MCLCVCLCENQPRRVQVYHTNCVSGEDETIMIALKEVVSFRITGLNTVIIVVILHGHRAVT